ncbi:hypothetical protein JXI42_14095 [bacterium]|nr:hypothetical protein [bacterium]
MHLWGVIKIILGGSLIYLSFSRNRTGLIIFGHSAIVVGCLLITWGIYLPPPGNLTLVNVVFGRPLFWGFFSVLGGICANFHGFCRCMRNNHKLDAKSSLKNEIGFSD